ncbi:ubiquitin-conjugating enzyme E2 Z-like [Hyalella azteca]|uniref:Ubiquitin-conjugating enzyme E2 Z-like n=1 Tax=Hyalella azteca TaxID=294128 RepID=A0A979FK04_HYAAZ|nr:ubiquitin-conjugating enzyme E2 Z-like [Hyalella azteca]
MRHQLEMIQHQMQELLGQGRQAEWWRRSRGWDGQQYAPHALRRARVDITALWRHKCPGIYAMPEETDITYTHAMIVGPPSTPYEGGFFIFGIRYGPDYPFEPPRVRCLSSYRYGRIIELHPHINTNGVVSLDILNTCSDHKWSSAHSLTSLLLSIQTILTDNVLLFDPKPSEGAKVLSEDVFIYDMYVAHQTISITVIKTLMGAKAYRIHPYILRAMKKEFFRNYQKYLEICRSYQFFDFKSFTVRTHDSITFIPHFAFLASMLRDLHHDRQLQAARRDAFKTTV